ncbi:putative cupin superfamily sugar epimerase [Catenuloplanes nepalensis]|uniref:Cupin superfamily sugar epimerase n=1 Tax=Catenuloplanes nepalensis TaxID=587533 RepID=A0ABT9N0L0_9ACTN|nr:cupin domain-containing protein [Catenuloplanes nepalensis]MDP9796981.1 putative cupin superfamily sugar epimerase [Catenuloplanes nepalensis]
MSRSSIVAELDLSPHPEGGWYRQTWRSGHEFAPEGYPGTRAAATAIYFLLHPGEEARWHQVRSDELWLWHSGGPMTLRTGGDGERPSEFVRSLVLGVDLKAGQRPQGLVPAGTWQAAVPAGHEPALVTCIVAPGFEYEDWRLA